MALERFYTATGPAGAGWAENGSDSPGEASVGIGRLGGLGGVGGAESGAGEADGAGGNRTR